MKLKYLYHIGENSITVVSGANDKLTPADVNDAEEIIKNCKVLVCQLEVPKEVTLEALKLAKKHGGM